MDLRTLEVNETCTFQVKDASGKLLFDGEKPVTATLYGPGSEVSVKAQSKRNRRVLERVQANGQQADTTLADNAEFLADITKRIDNAHLDGLTGREMFLAMYSNIKLGFLADQMFAKYGDWSNFTQGSTTD